jgi:aminobenzoyl-glutamate utilization protein B
LVSTTVPSVTINESEPVVLFNLPAVPRMDATDVGDVSWIVPTLQFVVATAPKDVPWHAWPVVACSGMSIGHKCLAVAAKVMAASCLDFLAQPETIQKMRDEWTARKKGGEYKSPLPPDLKPRVLPRKEE